MSDTQREQRFNIMRYKILNLERENLRSPRSNSEMVEQIIKIIKYEAAKICGGKQHAN